MFLGAVVFSKLLFVTQGAAGTHSMALEEKRYLQAVNVCRALSVFFCRRAKIVPGIVHNQLHSGLLIGK